MENIPERVARVVAEHVERLNHEHPGWFNRVSLEQESSALVVWPFTAEDAHGHLYELEIAWRTTIHVLRLMDKENER